MGDAHLVRDHIPVDRLRAAEVRRAVFEGQHHFQTETSRFLDAREIELAVRPGQDPGLLSEFFLQDFLAPGEVFADSLPEGGFVFVGLGLRVVLEQDAGRPFVSRGVVEEAPMKIVGVGGDFHPSGVLNLPNLLPGHEGLAHVFGGLPDPGGGHGEDRRNSVPLQHRRHEFVERNIGVVEGEQNGFVGQRAAGLPGFPDLLRPDKDEAVGPQVFDVFYEDMPGHVLGGGGRLGNIVVAEGEIVFRAPRGDGGEKQNEKDRRG